MRTLDCRTDYYDGVLRSQEPLYVRTLTYFRATPALYAWCSRTVDVTETVIGFCGESFKCLIVRLKNVIINCYDAQSFYDVTYGQDIHKTFGGIYGRSIDDVFRERLSWENHGVPIYAYQPKQLILNPLLRDFAFWVKYPAVQAAQIVHNWLLNQANPMKPIPPISDEMKLMTHGFNKYSFRRDKQC